MASSRDGSGGEVVRWDVLRVPTSPGFGATSAGCVDEFSAPIKVTAVLSSAKLVAMKRARIGDIIYCRVGAFYAVPEARISVGQDEQWPESSPSPRPSPPRRGRI